MVVALRQVIESEEAALWEQQMAALWSEVLQLENISIEDDFFDLGGDSLSAEELVTRLSETHGVEVSGRLLTWYGPSLAGAARVLPALLQED